MRPKGISRENSTIRILFSNFHRVCCLEWLSTVTFVCQNKNKKVVNEVQNSGVWPLASFFNAGQAHTEILVAQSAANVACHPSGLTKDSHTHKFKMGRSFLSETSCYQDFRASVPLKAISVDAQHPDKVSHGNMKPFRLYNPYFLRSTKTVLKHTF